MTDQETTLTKQLANFIVVLLLFIGVTSVTDVLTDVKAQIDATVAQYADPNNPGQYLKPGVQQVGDAAFAPLETGATISGNHTFIKWAAFAQGVFDSIESGVGPVISYFKGLIAGHKAAKAEIAASETK